MTTDPMDMVKGIDYDCIGNDIKCIADRDGAVIFEVAADGCRIVRVLAHTALDAEDSAREKLPKWFVEEALAYSDEDEEEE